MNKSIGSIGIAAGILWLAWTGGYWGWNHWPLAVINLGLGVVAIACTWRRWPWAAVVLAAAYSLMQVVGSGPDLRLAGLSPMLLLPRALWWLAYGAVFVLAQRHLDEDSIGQGMVVAGWVLLPVAIVAAMVDAHSMHRALIHRNVMAALLLLLIPAGLSTLRGRERLTWAVLGGLALGSTGSRGGLVGMAVGLVALGLPAAGWLTAGSAGVAFGLARGAILAPKVMAMVSSPSYSTVNNFGYDRLAFYRQAVEMWLSSPLFGHGPSSYFYAMPSGFSTFHAHCLPLTVLAEAGLVGLAALGFLAWQIWGLRRWGHWAWAGVAGIGAVCLVDEPVWFWGVGVGAALLLAVLFGSMEEKKGGFMQD